MAYDRRDNPGAAFTVSNFSEDFVLDANEEAGALLVADVLGTLIRELQRLGIIEGSVS